jgi:hypothetical protein
MSEPVRGNPNIDLFSDEVLTKLENALNEYVLGPKRLARNIDLPRVQRWLKVCRRLGELVPYFEERIDIRLRQSEHFRWLMTNEKLTFAQAKKAYFERNMWSGAQ